MILIPYDTNFDNALVEIPIVDSTGAHGNPATMVYGQQQHIFYRGPGGGLYHIWWDQSVNQLAWDQWGGPGGQTSAPEADGDADE